MVQIKPGESLYQAIGLEKAASAGEIRKAYLRLAVQLHPDKNPGDEEAKERFQTLQKVYTVLSDPERYRSAIQGIKVILSHQLFLHHCLQNRSSVHCP